jgi:hypothetical protein
MTDRSRLFITAIMFAVSFVGCSGGSQPGLDSSASGQFDQGSPGSASIHKATTEFTWSHSVVDIAAGQTVYESTLCKAGQVVINGTSRKKDIGEDITVIDSFPPDDHSWEVIAKNNGNHAESMILYLLCAVGS